MDAYDVIIVGTGAGGGTLARNLAPVDNKYISPDTWYHTKGRAFPQAFSHLALVNMARVADELLDEAGEP